MNYEKISAFSDEISERLDKQFEVLNRLGIKYFEVRGVNGENISVMSDEALAHLKARMDSCHIAVSSIGSPIGKIRITEDFEQHFEVFKRVVEIAKMLGTKYVRIFSFFRAKGQDWTEEQREEVFCRLSRLLEYAKQEDIVLLHENEKGIYGDTADRCLELMEKFYCENFKAVFDPANFIQCDQDTKQAYNLLKPYVAYMHIKDAVFPKGTVVPAGYGDGNLGFILSDLFGSGYDGFLSIEPHLSHFKGFADLEMGVIDEELPSEVVAENKFVIAYNALIEVLEKI